MSDYDDLADQTGGYDELMELAKRLADLLGYARRQPGGFGMKWEEDSRKAVRDFERFVAARR